jgi:hypothetical protein
MAEFSIPVVRRVTLRALTLEMTPWWRMASLAITLTIMAKLRAAPTIRIVALGALALVMASWR